MIWIFDENLRRVKILRQYEMAQWSNKFRDIGTFSINARYVDENLYLLDKTKIYYALLYASNDETKSEQWNIEHNVFGKIEKVSKEDEQDADFPNTIKVEGRLMPFLFTKRVINGTMDFTNVELIEFIKTMISSCFTKGTERFVDMSISSQKDTNIYDDVAITKQVTGGQLWDEIKDYLEQYKLGIVLSPNIVKTYELSDTYGNYMSGLSNIKNFVINVKTGVDRTRGNGTKTVIFSKSLSNIKRTSYNYDSENDMNVAYVAGEGEAEERKWYEIQKDADSKKNAWNREELWIDARDIQSEQDGEETTITQEEYDKLIEQRATEKFQENTISEEYTSTVNEYNKRYVYMEHYDLGDWVTVQDKELDIEIVAQIVEVTTTMQNNETINDITFEYGKANKTGIGDLKQIASSVRKISNTINYLDKKINSTIDLLYPVGSIYQTMDESFNPNKKWGGTWERVKGRVLVGVDENDNDFKTVNKIGGEKTHKLITSELPSHTHPNWVKRTNITVSATGNTYISCHKSNVNAQSGNNIDSTGKGNAHNNLQPYVTCYIWRRTK